MANLEEDEGNSLFMEGMFGGLVSIPLPVPEILQSLEKSKFKHKQEKFKKSPNGLKDNAAGGLWR